MNDDHITLLLERDRFTAERDLELARALTAVTTSVERVAAQLEEIAAIGKRVPCDVCHGGGESRGRPCPTCGGAGWLDPAERIRGTDQRLNP